MSNLDHAIETALQSTLGSKVWIESRSSIGGGCINAAECLRTNKGTFFVKCNASSLPGMFAKEAAGLEAMRASGTNLVIPKVIAHSEVEGSIPGFLIVEFLESGSRVRNFDDLLGEGLAQLHRASAAQFGFETDNYCGSTPQPNKWTERWVDFYRDQRLGFQLKLAVRANLMSKKDRRDFEMLLDRLEMLLAGTEEDPALIHGDLWSGNLHVAEGHPALIDPAAYYAHREAEFGMMRLFGGFSGRVYDAYQSTFALPDGWRERSDLYQLYHVINHANLFGGGYTSQAMSIVRRFI